MKQFLRKSLVPVAAVLALALVTAPLLALDAPAGPPPGPKGPLGVYLRCLGVVGLTDVQKADVRALLEAAKPKMDALLATLKADRAALRAAITAPNPDACAIGAALLKVEADLKAIAAEAKALHTAIEALLTPEQKAKLEGCLKAPRPNVEEDESEED